MDTRQLITAPVRTDQMPPGIPYIVVSEGAERFSFYGMRAILVVFMSQYLRDETGSPAVMSENEASKWYHVFLATNYFLPVCGAILADACWGKYRTIFWLSLVYCGGHLALAMDDTRMGLVVGLGLIAIGAGGIKPCVSANVGDQFGATNQHLLSRAFGWFYFAINFGSFFSIMLIPWVLEHYGPRPAFAIPGVLMAIAALIFWLGRYRFVHIPPAGRSFFAENFNVEGRRALGRIGLIYVFVAVFWSLWDQSGGEWILQAQKMDLELFGITWLAAQINAVNGIFILLMIVVCQYVIYPAINRVFPLTPLRKIGLGLAITAVSFLISAWIESRITAGLRPSVAWQLPAFLLLSTGEVMVSITSLEFAYTQAPRRMKSLVMSFYLLAISAGNLITALVHQVIANPDGSSKLPGATFYLFFVALCAATTVVFVFVARRYPEKTYLQDQIA